jgi:hypothetical protein
VLRKQLCLLMFPMCLRSHLLTTPNQKEATCALPKAVEEVWDGFGKVQGDADRQCADFVSLAQHLLLMVSPPPFDGFTYNWTWKWIEMSLGQATIFV